jgi:hypothetical protein
MSAAVTRSAGSPRTAAEPLVWSASVRERCTPVAFGVVVTLAERRDLADGGTVTATGTGAACPAPI